MPKQNLKPTKTGNQETRARLLRLKEMGVPIGSVHHPSPEPDRLALEQIDHDFARMYELLSGRVAVVVPATMRVLTSGILITGVAIWIPRIDCPLELSDPTGDTFYPDLMDRLLFDTRTKLLNDWLTSEVPLRPRQVKGVIVAEGWADVPLELQDGTPLRVELALRDQRRKELRFDLGVRVNLSLKRKYERRVQEHHERLRLIRREGGLFEGGQLGDQESVSPEEAINLRDASGEDARALHKPN
jgi:hypothetical protein